MNPVNIGSVKAFKAPLLIIGCVIAAMVTVIAFNSHWVQIQTVQIDMSKSSNQDLLFQRIRGSLMQQLKVYEGRYFWQVPLTTVFEAARKDRRVKSVAIFRDFPSRLRVEIEPHTPLLAYLSGDGRVYPVATDAALLPPISITESPDLPFLRGEDLKDETALREKTIELFNTVPDQGPLTKANISEIVYEKKEGFKIFVNGTRAEIKVGDSDFGPKLSRAQKVLAYLDSRNIKGRVIDARFSKKVVVRVRNTP
jgi:cell division septal protein FtsQ